LVATTQEWRLILASSGCRPEILLVLTIKNYPDAHVNGGKENILKCQLKTE
jgi:hypothetical protein